MAYEIKEAEGKFRIIEKFAHPEANPAIGVFTMETCNTREAAEEAIKQWEARDKVGDRIDDFLSELRDDFAGILDWSEIAQMIRDDLS